MNKKHTTFPDEVEVLHHNNEYLVLAETNYGRQFVAITSDGMRTDYPIYYSHSGGVGWDNPEWFSSKFKDKVKRHLITAWQDAIVRTNK